MATEQRSFQAECIDGNIAFLYNLPEDGLALRSVRISNGVPETTFEALSNVPTITEGDWATAFRLVSENTRPGFAYVNFHPFHPLESRWYMEYTPSWLRWTSIGKLLADADWIMKGIHVGVRTDESKQVYKSWKKSSHLQGLKTKLDFPIDSESTNPTIWMSCESAEVQEGENELYFPSEPKMQIKDGTRPLYSDYITEIYPKVAYHDEPKLLKMQEIMKLILAVEWLWEKGVRVSKEWMQMHTSESISGITSEVLLQKRRKVPRRMIPRPSNMNRPTIDVRRNAMKDSEGKEIIRRSEEKQFYGYYDCNDTEMKVFSDSGKLIIHQKSLKIGFHHNSDLWFGLYIPVPQNEESKVKRYLQKPLPKFSKEIAECLPQSEDVSLQRESGALHVRIDRTSDSDPDTKDTMVVSATMNDDLNSILSGMNPNDPIRPKIPGICDAIIPNVSSWQELISEFTVPRPSVWVYPGHGDTVLTASGGISTRDFPVRREPFQERARDRRMEEVDHYRRDRHTLSVRAQYIVSQGQIRLVDIASPEFRKISQDFAAKWSKGTPPSIKYAFCICNNVLHQHFASYRQVLKSRGHPLNTEDFYHGTDLACNLAVTQKLCNDGKCSICGITSAGMDANCIRKHSFQRFGAGFYLAPHSSKCNDYTQTNAQGHKAMILCEVLPGEKFLLSDNQQQLKRPPTGYDSVYGVVGCELNYPEIVVYDSRAVLPKYIIIYSTHA